MRAQFGTSSYERARGDLPQLPVINMVAEQAPTEETSIALQSRPGLSDRATDMGTDIDALFQLDGVLSNGLFGVSDNQLYAGTSPLGVISGPGPVSMAGNETGLMITAGNGLYFWDDSTLADVTFPDGAYVAKVFAGGSRFWFIRADSGQIYWTDSLEFDVDGLDFATAESFPDDLLDGLWIDDIAVLFGRRSVEFWPNTQDNDLPIQPLEGRVFSRGIRATGCAVQWGETFAWVADNHAVLANGDSEPQVLSNPGLQAKIEASETCRLWTFTWEGQEFLALRLDNATHIMGERNKLWSEVQSYGEDNWLPKCFANGVFGCSNGKTAAWNSGHVDFGGVLERRFRAGVPINSGGQFIDNVLLRTNPGSTPFLTGDYDDPVVEMRLSRDAGQTFGTWRSTTLARQGEYRQRVMWRACGMASRPGLFAEFRVTAPVDFRISDVLVNEPYGGR